MWKFQVLRERRLFEEWCIIMLLGREMNMMRQEYGGLILICLKKTRRGCLDKY